METKDFNRIIQELKDLGFEVNYDESLQEHKIVYVYSDFEILEAYVGKFTGVNDNILFTISGLQMKNLEDPTSEHQEYYIYIDNRLYFRSVDEFLQLLKLLGYKIDNTIFEKSFEITLNNKWFSEDEILLEAMCKPLPYKQEDLLERKYNCKDAIFKDGPYKIIVKDEELGYYVLASYNTYYNDFMYTRKLDDQELLKYYKKLSAEDCGLKDSITL